MIAAAATLSARIDAGDLCDHDANVGDDGTDAVRHLLLRVAVAKSSLRINLDPVALRDALAAIDTGLADLAPADEPVAIEVAALTLRCGREVCGDRPAAPDPALVELVRSGRRWFEALRSGKTDSIAAIAARERQQVSRTVSLAFLLPTSSNLFSPVASPRRWRRSTCAPQGRCHSTGTTNAPCCSAEKQRAGQLSAQSGHWHFFGLCPEADATVGMTAHG